MIPALKLICWLLGILLNQVTAFELYEFHAKDVPKGAFNQLVEKTGWNYVKCISICKEHKGCNALQVDDQSCRLGWLNLGYSDPKKEESRIKVFADQGEEPVINLISKINLIGNEIILTLFYVLDYLCTYKVRSLWQIPQIAANGKIFFLSSLKKDSTENRKFCQSYGAEEVMLKNRAEFNAFNKLIGKVCFNKSRFFDTFLKYSIHYFGILLLIQEPNGN